VCVCEGTPKKKREVVEDFPGWEGMEDMGGRDDAVAAYPEDLAGTVWLAAALLDHLFGGGLVAVVDAVDVDGEHTFEVLLGQIQQRLHLRDAGVGDPVAGA
jgi:hypothetical protein